MECNIDQKGRLARLYTGIVAIVFGIILSLLTYLSVLPATIGWLAVAGSIFGGAFAIFEARKGWCIVRAVGIRPHYDASALETSTFLATNLSA